MPHSHPAPRSLRVTPPLVEAESDVLAGLAGAPDRVRRMWPGQPGPRSPWRACSEGCCLEPVEGRRGDPVAWLRFLLREVLAPKGAASLARADRFGLPGGHRVDGRVTVGGRGASARRLVVSTNRVRVREAGGQMRER